MKKNEVHIIENDIVEIIYHGEQNAEAVNELNKAVLLIAKEYKEKNKKLLLLGCMEDIQSTTSLARRNSSEAINNLPFEKAAVYGASVFIKYLSKLVLFATGKANVVQFFDNRQQAIKWLMTEE